MRIAHYSLNEQEFRDLVAGRHVTIMSASGIPVCRIILQDIGFATMGDALDEACKGDAFGPTWKTPRQ